ncbi:hypothetical protein F4821DRAFT_234766 [Hypoxylon rubiginosum]|uniref:Uncharacterized protein n=1 Tax=Hypoxylon rubiginosum TaxID=110542 RepID=A0ACC0D719_9PEZI|nr:hypothetical protein F4821DRAFT_234766 [Hypoxylon rubiginosum]
MQTSTLLLGALVAASSGIALAVPFDNGVSSSNPFVKVRADYENVGFGQQIQTSSEANYWVVWIDGETACDKVQTLSPLTSSPCDVDFQLPSGTTKLKLSDCNGNNEPASLYTSAGSFVRTCKQDNSKIHCGGNDHDIVKHGKCNS